MMALRRGAFSRSQYAAFICDAYHYARQMAPMVGSAAVRLVESHPALAAYLFGLAAEDVGNEALAHSDLVELGWTDAQVVGSAPSPACQEMVALAYYYACHDNPAGVIGWTYVMQSVGADFGASVAKTIDAALELNGRGTRFLTIRGGIAASRAQTCAELINRHLVAEADCYAFGRVAEGALIGYLGLLNAAEAGALTHAAPARSA